MCSDDRIRFRAGKEKEAAEQLDEIHLGGINRSQLAREGLATMLQEVATDEDKIRIYEAYQRGDVAEDVAEIILGDDLTTLQADVNELHDAAEEDTSQYLA